MQKMNYLVAPDVDALLELVKGTSTECVGADQTCAEPSTLVMHCELGARRRLSCSLNTDGHEDVYFALGRFVGFGTRVDQADKFVKYRLDHVSVSAAFADCRWLRLEMENGEERTFWTTFFLLASRPPARSASSKFFLT